MEEVEIDSRAMRRPFLHYTPRGGLGVIRRIERYKTTTIHLPVEIAEGVGALADRYGATQGLICVAIAAIMLREIAAEAPSPDLSEAIKESRINKKASPNDPFDKYTTTGVSINISDIMFRAIKSRAKEEGATFNRLLAEYVTVCVKKLVKDIPFADRALAPFILGKQGPLAEVQHIAIEIMRVRPGDVIIVRRKTRDNSYGGQTTRLFVEEAQRAFPNNMVLFLPHFMDMEIFRSAGE